MAFQDKPSNNATTFPEPESHTAAADLAETPGTTPAAIEKSDAADAETPKLAHDSMVTVRLSEPPALTLDTKATLDDDKNEKQRKDSVSTDRSPVAERESTGGENSQKRSSAESRATPDSSRTLKDELYSGEEDGDSRRSSDADSVNWEELEKTEDAQTKDDETDNSTTLLLQQLEQENAKLATNPKTVKVQVARDSNARRPRPPSMAQLRQMIDGPTPSALRYSMLPPPPMTDLEFWAALVKDYQQTAGRLPTLLSNKIHKGIPPPLRGVVWQSMSGARDAGLEEQYEKLSGESSPYEPLIGKDLGRSFPGVDMFRDPDGDGQRMLGRVLKTFSLYDTKIGYCQGLAFLVGPLLMHMPDKQAFCVLVRLMERYDLRTCFLPDLSGLHVRIYQFRELLKSNLPELSKHFEDLQVDPAYVSQWFLSFFAVTCPLPMLFRIYDVIFAEGAPETLMRVALSLMRKNEQRLLACTELEDAMQLLLSRGLWDCYHYDAEEFVDDFVSLTSEVSRENLGQLEQGYRRSLVVATNASRTSDTTNAASRFLGRIWASSTIAPKSNTTLSPGAGASPRPLSMLRRSASKQSLASTLNSIEASSSSVTSSASTEASLISRDSSRMDDEASVLESTPVGNKTANSTKTVDERLLHNQIEDLLTAMGELQRSHTVLANQLQREKDERQEDQQAVRPLLDALKQEAISKSAVDEKLPASQDGEVELQHDVEETATDLPALIEQVQARFPDQECEDRESVLQSKTELHEELVSAKDQLAVSASQTQGLNRQIHDLSTEVASLKDQLRESHAHVRLLHQDKHRLEHQVQKLRTTSVAMEPRRREASDMSNVKGHSGGLREFKLARSKSTPSKAGGFSKRLSSLPARHESVISMTSTAGPATPTAPAAELTVPPTVAEHEALLTELAISKTAEAVARQEADEAQQKLEAFRKACGVAPGEIPALPSPGINPMTAAGMFGRLTGQTAMTPPADTAARPLVGSPSGSSTSGGGFWGWRR
ncbi:Protein of unknown functionlike protein [Emericellopsis cladophorae]|uniref:Rab-GAP TBC domain-containing protein n=1 Tax=Emericellopsis cladophorae TaxID=2686198 RepID=A0A9Q0BGL9_9HYPO|nr:Protein of unknown functionlike protein [Emericellopsis cladophorae]KAI6785162.1 Protein of unknown functionlike protein [Emericellopsis cladophorae]